MPKISWLSSAQAEKEFLEAGDGDLIAVKSSNGFMFALKNGKISKAEETWKDVDEADFPIRFDFDEFMSFHGIRDGALPAQIDILDLGYRTAKGEYVPPDEDWRELYYHELENGQKSGPAM